MGGASMNWGGFDRAVGEALKRMSNRRNLMEAIGETLVSGVHQRFNKEEAPDGSKWPKNRRGGKTLTDTARLKQSIDCAATDDAVRVGSNAVYSRIHQFGGTIKPKNKKFLRFKNQGGDFIFSKEVNIPARPYLGVSKDDLEEVQETIKEFLQDAFRG